MLKKLKMFFVSFASMGTLLVPVAVPVTVAAQTGSDTQEGLCEGINLQVNGECDPSSPEAASKINQILKLVINIFSLIVGVVAVIMIIVGGLKYITSGGDSSNITGAKNTILYAVVGLVVVALAQFIVRFVLSKATTDPGTDL